MIARPHYPSMDGLRCLAILPIVWHHAATREYAGALGRGPLGVDLFFALSGFLITSLLLADRRSLGSFWMRRSLRIFPLYYVVLGLFVLHALVARPDGPVRSYFLASVPFYATYTSNLFRWEAVDHPIVFAFAWSLAAEEQFYLWWPVVVRAVSRSGAALAMFAVIAVDQAAERDLLPVSGFALNALRSFATPIGLGALLALAPRVPVPRWGSVAVAALVAFAIVRPWPLFTTQVLLTLLVGACALRSDHYLAPVLEHPVVRHVGVVSYGIYLVNVPVVTAVRAVVRASDGVVFAVATLACIAVATLTRQVIELPFLRLRDRQDSGDDVAASSRRRPPLARQPR